jgi:Tol biopolymer transport system component
MRRWWIAVAVFTTAMMGLAGSGEQVQAKAPGPNGQIAFARQATPPGDGHVSYTVNPDGSQLQQLFAGHSDFPRWSPDGRQVGLGDMDCQFDGTCSAVIVDPDTGSSRILPNPDPTLYDSAFCGAWSPDGARLACSLFGAAGVILVTVRSSDGGGLKKILSCDVFGPGAECGVADFSPDGKQVLLGGPDQDGATQFFIAKLNGSGLRQITPSSTRTDGDAGASWSPDGGRILFGANVDAGHRRSIFVVNADGTGLHQIPVPGCGGAFSDPQSIACFAASWSPDGTEIIFTRASAFFNVTNIYTANADGSGLFQVTHESTGLEVTAADWGTHPLAS